MQGPAPPCLLPCSPCPMLVSAGINKVGPGESAYINDSLGLHAVRCDDGACGGPGAEEGAVSLHIYAPVSSSSLVGLAVGVPGAAV